jgi:hypothetical protein
MAKVTLECPGCAAKLNLPDESRLGKKIRCPKCSEVFVAEASAGDADEDLFADEGEDDVSKSNSVRNPRGSGGSSGKIKKSGGKKGGSADSGNGGLMIGGGIAVAVVLLIAGLYFGGVFGSAQPAPVAATLPPITPVEKTLALRWMPADTEFLIHVKLSDIWAAPLLKPALELPQVAPNLAEFQKMTSLLPADVESLTIGVADLSGALLRTKAANAANGPAMSPMPRPTGFGPSGLPASPMNNIRPEDQRMLMVLRSKKPIELKTITDSSPGTQQKIHNGKTYYEPPATPSGTTIGLWNADSTTLLFGTLKDLQAAMDRGETVTPRAELMGLDHQHQLVMASVIKETNDADVAPGIELPGALALMKTAVKDYGLKRASLGLSVRGGIDFSLSALTATAEQSQKLKGEIETQLNAAKEQFSLIKATAPPLIGELGQTLIDNIKLDEQSQQVRLASSVPDSDQQKLEQLPAILTVMAMTGAFSAPQAAAQSKVNIPTNALPQNPLPQSAGPSEVVPASPTSAARPVQTEPIEAIKADGLPGGVTLAASITSNEVSNSATAGKQTLPLDVFLDSKGDGLKSICGSGELAISTLTLEGGGKLNVFKDSAASNLNPHTMIVPFGMEAGAVGQSATEHPEGTMRIRFKVDPPSTPAKKISLMEGTFKYLTAEKSDDISIEDAPKRALRPLNDPQLKSTGVKLLLNKGASGADLLTLSCGKEHFLGTVWIVSPDAAVTPSMFLHPLIEKGQSICRMEAKDQGGKFPEKLQLKFRLHQAVKEQTVSFRFENLPLPKSD